jgi:hypothetical protein
VDANGVSCGVCEWSGPSEFALQSHKCSSSVESLGDHASGKASPRESTFPYTPAPAVTVQASQPASQPKGGKTPDIPSPFPPPCPQIKRRRKDSDDERNMHIRTHSLLRCAWITIYYYHCASTQTIVMSMPSTYPPWSIPHQKHHYDIVRQ